MDDKINFGIVGTGRMASAMMTALGQRRDVRVTSVCSSSVERASQFARRYGIRSSHGDLQAFLSDDGIHAVYIANKNIEHAAVAIASLNAGKAVLCEKPVAITTVEGRAVVAAARSTGRLLMEAMWTPFLPAYERLYSLVKGGSLGRATHLEFSFGYRTSPRNSPHLFDSSGGGVLLDRGVYGIALAHRLFGPADVTGSAVDRNADGVDVSASLQLSHRAGGQSQLAFSFTSLMSNSAAVACEMGMVGLLPPAVGAETVMFQHAGETQPESWDATAPGLKQRLKENVRRHPLARRIKSGLSGPKTEFHSFGSDPYLPQLSHFVRLLRDGRVESDINTLESSLAVLEVVDAAKATTRG